MQLKKYHRKIFSPIGNLLLISDHKNILEIKFTDDIKIENSNLPILLKTEKQLQEYFAGKRKKFDISLKLIGTEFQISVWNELSKIPFGKTISYKILAIKIGDKNKARAVGNANGKNPIPIIIPCHRVIANDGFLGGYTGGIEIKQELLKLEKSL